MGIAGSRRHPATDPDDRGPAEALSAPDVRALALVSGMGRLAIGVGLALAPRAALGALGFTDASPGMVTISRIAGGRDIVLGVATLASLGDARDLRRVSLANAAVDAGDAATFAAGLAAGEDVRAASLRGVAAAVPAALAGLWVARRLA
jgi:hypothetical protein